MLRKYFLLFSLILSTSAFAGTLARDYAESDWPFVATLSLGPAWSRPGETHTLNLSADVLKTFTSPHHSRSFTLLSTAKDTQTLATGELFLGFHGLINGAVEGQLGLALALASQVKLHGEIYEDANPALNNYTYAYKIRHARVAIKGKALYDPCFYDLFPYLSGSAGVGYNHADKFGLTSRIAQEVPELNFPDHKSTAFSYTIGTGVEFALDPLWRIGIGYEFANWGTSNLRRSTGQTEGNGLFIRNLRTHEFQLSVTYIC